MCLHVGLTHVRVLDFSYDSYKPNGVGVDGGFA